MDPAITMTVLNDFEEDVEIRSDDLRQTRYRLCAGICYFVNYTGNALSK